MKDVLTVEYLPYYKKYRLWNSAYEDWFTNKKELIRVCKAHQSHCEYYTYGTQRLIEDFAKRGVVLNDSGKEVSK